MGVQEGGTTAVVCTQYSSEDRNQKSEISSPQYMLRRQFLKEQTQPRRTSHRAAPPLWTGL